MTRRHHSEEFKREIVRQLEAGEKRISQLCREHHLDPGMVREWKRKVEAHGERAFRDPEASELAQALKRIAELEGLVGRITLEKEFLKKACKSAGCPLPKGIG